MNYDKKKYEPKHYKPYEWVAENLKFGFIIFLFGLIGFIVYKLIEWI